MELNQLNLFEDIISKISPLEFEKFCFEILNAYAEEEKLNSFEITHNKKMQLDDENYQIDIYAEYIALSVKMKVIVECKHLKRPVERKEVILLIDKVHSLAAHKGILISSSGFQSGAIERAIKDGIALLQIIDKNIMHITASLPKKNDNRMLEYYKKSPPYYALQYTGEVSDFPDKKIYPTPSMYLELKQHMLNIDNN